MNDEKYPCPEYTTGSSHSKQPEMNDDIFRCPNCGTLWRNERDASICPCLDDEGEYDE